MDSSADEAEDMVLLRYESQHFTGKVDGLWTFNYSAYTTPLVTIMQIHMPKNTQISNINFSDFNWAPTGESQIEIYPLVREFHLSFNYRLGVSGGPIIPRPGSSTTTTTSITTTIPSTGRENPIWPQLLLPIIIVASGALIVYYLIARKKEKASKPLGNHGAPAEGGGIEVESMEVKWTPVEASSALEERPAKPEERSIKDSIVNMLDVNEKKIVKMLEESSDEITQAYVYKSTGIPKSSLSDTIKRLEKRNIIEIKKEGRINWLKLKDWVFN